MAKTAICSWLARGGTRYLTKTLLVMKLTIILLTVALLNVQAKSISQTVTIAAKNTSWQSVFASIEEQTGYVVFCNSNILEGIAPVTIKVKNMDLSVFLSKLLERHPLEFVIKQDNIIISHKIAKATDRPLDNYEEITFAHPILIRVTDSTGAPLSGATVSNKNNKFSGLTNAQGVITLNVNVQDILEITFIGFDRSTYTVKDNSSEVSITLKVLHVDNEIIVEVLGTHFNVNAYENENTVTTTLLEGAVKVSEGFSNVLLQPGQQAQVLIGQQTPTKISVINDAAIDKVMAWKNGLFNFEGADIKTVMRQISRWYDVEVVYEGTVPDLTFVGKLKRNLNLADLLDVLKRTEINFTIEDNKIIVKP